jgi:hypothetical protein
MLHAGTGDAAVAIWSNRAERVEMPTLGPRNIHANQFIIQKSPTASLSLTESSQRFISAGGAPVSVSTIRSNSPQKGFGKRHCLAGGGGGLAQSYSDGAGGRQHRRHPVSTVFLGCLFSMQEVEGNSVVNRPIGQQGAKEHASDSKHGAGLFITLHSQMAQGHSLDTRRAMQNDVKSQPCVLSKRPWLFLDLSDVLAPTFVETRMTSCC